MTTVIDLWAELSHAERQILQAIRHGRTVARNLNQEQEQPKSRQARRSAHTLSQDESKWSGPTSVLGSREKPNDGAPAGSAGAEVSAACQAIPSPTPTSHGYASLRAYEDELRERQQALPGRGRRQRIKGGGRP